MSKLRLSHRPRRLFGAAAWMALGLVLFAWLYSISAPPSDIGREMAAAGPDGVTVYFASPEAAVREINTMLGAHAWRRLARYYDLSNSDVKEHDLISGVYFTGSGADAKPHPFPPGYVFVSSEPSGLSLIRRIIVAKSLNGTPDAATETSFLMRRAPEGYRILPGDAAQRLKTSASAP